MTELAMNNSFRDARLGAPGQGRPARGAPNRALPKLGGIPLRDLYSACLSINHCLIGYAVCRSAQTDGDSDEKL